MLLDRAPGAVMSPEEAGPGSNGEADPRLNARISAASGCGTVVSLESQAGGWRRAITASMYVILPLTCLR